MSVQRQIDHLVAYQAAEWYENLKGDNTRRNTEFVRWISESPRHMEAFLAIASEAPVVRGVLTDGQFDLQSLLKEVSGEENVHPLRPLRSSKPSLARSSGLTRRRAMLSVAAALVAIAISIPVAVYLTTWQRFETPVGEQRTIQLREGSIVTLNAQSRMEVKIGDSQREIRLPQGEATFKVAHDASRPFRVRTPGALVEAVGTQFDVYARSDGTTTVAVIEGKVKVFDVHTRLTHLGVSGSGPVSVAAGEEAQVVQSTGRIELHPEANVAEAIAWQQRKLVFRRTSLEEIAEEFNRYNKFVQIHLEQIPPRAFRFSGAFNADDPQSLATLLMHEPDLIVQQSEGEIIIRQRTGANETSSP